MPTKFHLILPLESDRIIGIEGVTECEKEYHAKLLELFLLAKVLMIFATQTDQTIGPITSTMPPEHQRQISAFGKRLQILRSKTSVNQLSIHTG